MAGNIPETLVGKRLISLDVGALVAGTKFRGEFEERLKNAMAEIRKVGNIILFIDELHTICGAGASEGALDAANILWDAGFQITVHGSVTLAETAISEVFDPLKLLLPHLRQEMLKMKQK